MYVCMYGGFSVGYFEFGLVWFGFLDCLVLVKTNSLRAMDINDI